MSIEDTPEWMAEVVLDNLQRNLEGAFGRRLTQEREGTYRERLLALEPSKLIALYESSQRRNA